PRAELARLGDRAAGELGAADAGGEAEVVLDPARRARLPAERGALDNERPSPSDAPYTAAPSPAGPAPTTSRSTSSRGASSRPTPSARESCPAVGRRSSAPPGRRTSGAVPPGDDESIHVWGRRLLPANAST